MSFKSNSNQPMLPPVIILGGDANALSVSRDLSALGVDVYVICPRDAAVRFSRHCRWIDVPLRGSAEDSWARYLLEDAPDSLQGAVLLTCSDVGIGVLSAHREQLARRYRLDDSNPAAAIAMLDKLSTYQIAKNAGVATPAFWMCRSRDELLASKDSLKYPLLVKPRLSHVFQERFGSKFIVVSDFEDLLPAFDVAANADIDTMLVELIPGGDEQLCSYYTYLDADGKPLFHFTKRMIRRYPAGMGTGCYHITDWVPEIVEPALKLLTSAGARGLCNVEFKRDIRDGQHKLMECNARFTASDCLVSASRFSLSQFIYKRLVGLPMPELTDFKQGLRLWDPYRDFTSCLELRRMGKMTFGGWLKSVLHRQTFAYFRWTDPGPALARALRPIARKLRSGQRPVREANPVEPSVASV